jgi:hypothetical protein
VEAGEAVVHEECAARAALLQAPDYPDYEDLLDLTDDERRALPARFHTPHFDSVGTPNAWLCRVCWGDGWVTQWPCKAAQENGTQVFTHAAFVGDSATELVELRARVSTLSDELSGACLARYEEEQENARLLAERHSTNEALSDAVVELHAREAETAPVDADFYQPGHTYTDVDSKYDWKFRCDVVTTHPEDGERTALGWRFFNGVWSECAYGEDDWDVQQFAAATAVSKTVPQQRQQEDPHAGPLHQTFALGRDDLQFSAAEIARWQVRHGVVPQQTTGLCPRCRRLFEDCTCGGAA